MGLAILLAAALQAAAAADPAQKIYEVEFAPLAPSESQYAHLGPAGPYYPERAFRNHQSGEGQLRCIAGVDGDLQQCALFAEEPAESGFATAARILADRKRVRAAGSPPVGESTIVRVPFVLGAPVKVTERAVRTQAVKVTAPNVRGHAEVGCVVADKGLDHCYVLYFRSLTPANSATTAAAALSAVGQVPLGNVAKDSWVIIPVDVTPTAAPEP
jgi:hypothetical protein